MVPFRLILVVLFFLYPFAQGESQNAIAQDSLVTPGEVQLEGNQRHVDIGSSLGRVQLRWARHAEKLFGRTPERAVIDALRTASRALFAGTFPPMVRDSSNSWEIVFMDETVPDTQIPMELVTNCHPAWMTPPARLYFVAQRIVAGCYGASPMTPSKADAELTKIALHEIGHVIEYRLSQGKIPIQRIRSEGFATWFAAYSSDFSTILSKGSVRSHDLKLAASSIGRGMSETFQGTEADYMVASLPFHAIQRGKGVQGIVDVYQSMVQDGLSFEAALKKTLLWDIKRLQREMQQVLLP